MHAIFVQLQIHRHVIMHNKNGVLQFRLNRHNTFQAYIKFIPFSQCVLTSGYAICMPMYAGYVRPYTHTHTQPTHTHNTIEGNFYYNIRSCLSAQRPNYCLASLAIFVAARQCSRQISTLADWISKLTWRTFYKI